MKNYLFLFLLIIATSCNQKTRNETVVSDIPALKPFNLIIKDYDYAMAYQLQYLITEKELKIFFIGELEGEKDSTLFSRRLTTSDELKKLSELNLDSLDGFYRNPCIVDGIK